jgi:putative FmdB family regulatory protein
MPIYLYKCQSCGREKEVIQKMDSPPPTCPECPDVEMERTVEPVSPFRWGRGGGWS